MRSSWGWIQTTVCRIDKEESLDWDILLLTLYLLTQAWYMGRYPADTGLGRTVKMGRGPKNCYIKHSWTFQKPTGAWCYEIPWALRWFSMALGHEHNIPTLGGWTAVGLWLMLPRTGFGPTQVNPTRFKALCLNHSATPLTPKVKLYVI